MGETSAVWIFARESIFVGCLSTTVPIIYMHREVPFMTQVGCSYNLQLMRNQWNLKIDLCYSKNSEGSQSNRTAFFSKYP